MDQASESAQQQVQPPSLLILGKSERAVRSTITYLERRGVPVRFAKTLTEALDVFSKKEANMLLLSINFPHPKIEMIPTLMTQSFPNPFEFNCILFAEEHDRKTSTRLSGVKAKNVLMGQVSGPVVMMKIKQIERELLEGPESSSDPSSRSFRASEQDQSISIRGSVDKVREEAYSSLMAAAREGETFVQKGDAPTSGMVTPNEAGTETNSSEQSASENSRSGYAGGSSFGGTTHGPIDRENSQGSRKSGVENGNSSPNLNSQQSQNAASSQSPSEFEEADDSTFDGISPESEEQADAEGLDSSGKPKYQRKQQDADYLDAIEKSEFERQAAAKSGVNGARPKEVSAETNLLLECARDAFEIVAGEPQQDVARIPHFRFSMLVAVRSANLRGAFVVGVGKSKHPANDIMERFQVAFFSMLRAKGIELSGSDQFAIELDDVIIASKSAASSDHIFALSESDLEMVVAFVSAEDPIPRIDPYEKNMLSVPLSDLLPDEPITFNVFLHLKRNGKFLRYVKVGAKISEKQVARLERRNITHVLLDGAEKETYSRHYAAHSIQPSRRRKNVA